MKKIIYVLLVLLVLSVISVSVTVNAQVDSTEEPTEAPSETPDEETEGSDIKEKINDLKERLATKVAELRAQNKRSFYGVIKEKSETSMILLYRDEEIPVAVDDETVYYSINADNKQAEATMYSLELGETAALFGHFVLDNKTVI